MPHARDTDADWRRIGDTQPYWGVLSHAEFRAEAFDDAAGETFYASGRNHLANLAEDFQRLLGATLKVEQALDFGCGVGRLAEAMAPYARSVTGYDISPGMLRIARGRGSGVDYVDQLPSGPFDWINAFIVFQHIPPARGVTILRDLLTRLAAGGLLSLHFTVWREDRHVRVPSIGARLRGFQPPVGEVQMYDYDLGAVVRELDLAGVREMAMIAVEHVGHHGVMIFARKPEAAGPSRY